MFFLAVFAGLTYKHYKVTGELLPLQWLGIESPKAALKSMTPPQAGGRRAAVGQFKLFRRFHELAGVFHRARSASGNSMKGATAPCSSSSRYCLIVRPPA